MPVVSEACCASSDVVNPISAFFFLFLQDRSLLNRHAGRVVIEQKIESERGEIGRQDKAEGKVRQRGVGDEQGGVRGDDREGPDG